MKEMHWKLIQFLTDNSIGTDACQLIKRRVDVNSIFIQIDAHNLIDAHPLHHQPLGTQKWVKLMITFSKNAWISDQILGSSLCINFMSCSRSVRYY